jgi:hypothetical protein
MPSVADGSGLCLSFKFMSFLVTLQQIWSMKGFPASCAITRIGCLRAMVQLMSSLVLGSCEDLIMVSVVDVKASTIHTLLQPGNSQL